MAPVGGGLEVWRRRLGVLEQGNSYLQLTPLREPLLLLGPGPVTCMRELIERLKT